MVDEIEESKGEEEGGEEVGREGGWGSCGLDGKGMGMVGTEGQKWSGEFQQERWTSARSWELRSRGQEWDRVIRRKQG